MSVTIDPSGINLVLRGPEFSNVYRITPNNIRRKSRSGDLIVFCSENWVAPQMLVYSFTVLTSVEVSALVAFLKGKVGKSFTIVDHAANTRLVFLYNPIIEVVRTRPACSNAVNLELLISP
jgi:hypothetical protein